MDDDVFGSIDPVACGYALPPDPCAVLDIDYRRLETALRSRIETDADPTNGEQPDSRGGR